MAEVTTDRECLMLREGNAGIWFSFAMCRTVHATGGIFLYEHPEYLGRVPTSDVIPTSSFLWPEFQVLARDTRLIQVTVHQCMFGASHAKPTRLATTAFDFGTARQASHGPMQLSAHHDYLGPLPRCKHRHPRRQPYSTSGSEQYPPPLCGWMARHLLQSWLSEVSSSDPFLFPIDLSGQDEVR